jgi:multiple sugar transport system permease protein
VNRLLTPGRELLAPARAIGARWSARRVWAGLRSSEAAFAYLLNAPALVTIVALVAFPIGYSFWLSLQRYNLTEPGLRAFIGLGNYVSLLSDQTFLSSLRVSAEFSVIVVVLTVLIGVAMATVLNETFAGRGVLRSLVLLPWAMPGVINGLMWRWIFDPKVGVLNGALYSLGLIHSYRPWLISPGSALIVAALAQVWNLVPFAVIILLAGLNTIPAELYDAARVDRAHVLQRFRQVTVFDTVYILTGGGPGDATNLISLQTVQTVLTYTNFGLGDAYAYVITAITLVVSLVYVGVLYRRGSFEV